VIKPRTRGKQFVRHVTRLERENHETVHAYAQFLGESVEYVLNQLIDTVLTKDKEFAAWRAEHPQSCAPRPTSRVRRRAVNNGRHGHGHAVTDNTSPSPSSS